MPGLASNHGQNLFWMHMDLDAESLSIAPAGVDAGGGYDTYPIQPQNKQMKHSANRKEVFL